MPEKARYWKNPEKYRRYQRAYYKKLVRLGYKGGIKNANVYVRYLAYRNSYNKAHRAELNAAQARYLDKIRKAGFSTGKNGRYYYSRMKGTLKNGYRRPTKN